MFRFVALFALVSCAFAGTLPDELDGRIVNGVDTTIEAHPYQVSLFKGSNGHFCGGSIIDEDTVVTAAHCLQGSIKAADFKVRLGSTDYKKGGEVVSVRAFKNHDGYNSKTHENDVAVIKLKTPVRESEKVRYVKLATTTPRTGTSAVVTGWGTKCFMTCISLPETLQEVEVDIVDYKACESKEYKYGSQIKESMVCAYAVNKDACQGDSGGPLVSGGELVGVVSWGAGCARAGYPGVYADVPRMHKWISDTTKSL